MAKCLIPECVRAAATRGQCKSCYRASSKLVESGATTWESLVKQKLASPLAKPQRVKAAIAAAGKRATKPKPKRRVSSK